MPLSKMKLHRITFMLEEKLTYQVDRYHLTRIEPTSRFQLLCVRHPQSLSTLKHFAHSAPPLLPIMSRDDSHSSEAVLLPFADPPPTLLSQQNEQEERTERLAHLMSPDGPWHLAGTLKVPQNYLHTSHQHPKSFVTIKHALKVYLRVEKGNDETDPKTGRKKQFDIIIETPVNILSKYCRHDWASLPPYESLDPVPTTGDEHAGEGEENGVRIGPTLQSRESSRSDLFMNPRSPIVSPAHISRPPSPLLGPTRVPSNPPSQPQTPSQAHPLRTDSPRRTRSSGPSTPIEGMTPVYSDRERERDGERGRGRDRESESRAQTSQRYASLMAGFEDEVGELPPTYQSVTGTPGAVQQCSPLGFPARSSPSRSASMGRSISVAVRQRGRYGTGASTRVSRENTPTGSGSRSRNPSRTRTAGDADANAGITAMSNASWVSAVNSTGTSYLELRSGSRTPDRHDPFVFFLPL
ncbi:hypothetical protein FRC18_006697 [Serendipita sp. 400]|nr:hypothetical protein FRC18_006697 [Serendipita sp. 400]